MVRLSTAKEGFLMVLVKDLTICFEGKVIVNKVSCELKTGRITTFIGESGAGKTTLLKALIDLVPVQEGSVVIDGKQLSSVDAKKKSEMIGYVFQDFNLFENCTVLQNCLDPLLVRKVPYDDAYKCALNQLTLLKMNDYIDQYPQQLSGGQKQRVAIARSLCLHPKVLLFDEPTASLDPENTENFIAILKNLVAQGMTIGLSSHDMMFVKKVFDCVYYIKKGSIVEFCDVTQPDTSCEIIKKCIQ